MGHGPLLCAGQLGLTSTRRARRPHLLLYVSRVLLHEFGEADVVCAEAAEPVQDAGLAGMQKRQLLRHLEGQTAVTDGRTGRAGRGQGPGRAGAGVGFARWVGFARGRATPGGRRACST